jgi:hypothetical protein
MRICKNANTAKVTAGRRRRRDCRWALMQLQFRLDILRV